MKQIILFGLLAGLLSVNSPLRAQVAPRDSDARKGSRLELGRTGATPKSTAGGLPNQRFSLVKKPATASLDRALSVSKNAPINAYYRSLLVARAGAKAGARTTAAEAAGSVEGKITKEVSESDDNLMFANEHIAVSNIYPNPANDYAEISYQYTGAVNEAKLVLINVLGSPVAEYELAKNDRKLRIATSDMMTGYYFYQLSLDGKKVATKKLLVRHQ
ncbi:T9SS type A sorting domain-containing protein [Spirosoma rhododendri]|uniref:T9SS type A sorting domain-containing protein n=1 Tax=Spirosoma rhododendri TaxID=2728024 RepID=A0A7L5DVS2_9BACT|nr:T9SS type A sorting domain-containing protein [Spirosoma rhododendri]QJD80067.1 T9SS type A sorting domain-containing protein [Spirosoma rhododendri]